MILGLDRFRESFAGYEEHYAVIGGAACHLVMDDAGLDFRSTKDIDMVLCVEVVGAPFAERLRRFLEAGGYEAREHGNERPEFYRFHRPSRSGFPAMIELFARHPGTIDLADGQAAAPIPVEEDATSLSAILLDPDYYAALQTNRRIIDGVSVLDERLLIPFKGRAHVDLARRREAGETIRGGDIAKHARDIFRLIQLLPTSSGVEVGDTIRDDLRTFVERVESQGTLDPRAFGVAMSRGEGLERLRRIYGLV